MEREVRQIAEPRLRPLDASLRDAGWVFGKPPPGSDRTLVPDAYDPLEVGPTPTAVLAAPQDGGAAFRPPDHICAGPTADLTYSAFGFCQLTWFASAWSPLPPVVGGGIVGEDGVPEQRARERLDRLRQLTAEMDSGLRRAGWSCALGTEAQVPPTVPPGATPRRQAPGPPRTTCTADVLTLEIGLDGWDEANYVTMSLSLIVNTWSGDPDSPTRFQA